MCIHTNVYNADPEVFKTLQSYSINMFNTHSTSTVTIIIPKFNIFYTKIDYKVGKCIRNAHNRLL